MYRYKINNSNTIYVSWEYYDEVRKICRKLKIKSSVRTYVSSQTNRDVIIPMPLGQQILSRRYGLGILVSKSSNGIISIRFGEHIKKYLYPNAFKLGELRLI